MRDEGGRFSFGRSIALAVTLGLHAGALLLLTRPPVPADTVASQPVPEPEWVAVELEGPPDAAPSRLSLRPPARVLTRPRTERRARGGTALAPDTGADVPVVLPAGGRARPPAAVAEASVVAPSTPRIPAAPLVALDDAARPRLPYEPLYGGAPKAATADFHTPGNGREDEVFYRPPALEPRTTRFAKAWRGDTTLLDEWLGRLVEATSGEVSVPLNPKFNLVCRGSLAGLGGECRIVRNAGSGVIVERPPPAPWERSTRVQCAELREQLANATEEEALLHLLERLTALCTGNEKARREAGLPVES